MPKLVLVTDEPQAKLLPDGTPSSIHLPRVDKEAAAILAAFGPFAERRSRISADTLKEALTDKQVWFFLATAMQCCRASRCSHSSQRIP